MSSPTMSIDSGENDDDFVVVVVVGFVVDDDVVDEVRGDDDIAAEVHGDDAIVVDDVFVAVDDVTTSTSRRQRCCRRCLCCRRRHRRHRHRLCCHRRTVFDYGDDILAFGDTGGTMARMRTTWRAFWEGAGKHQGLSRKSLCTQDYSLFFGADFDLEGRLHMSVAWHSSEAYIHQPTPSASLFERWPSRKLLFRRSRSSCRSTSTRTRSR